MQKTACVCFIDHQWSDGYVSRDIGATLYRETENKSAIFDISCRGTSYCYSFGREEFLRCCHKYNVEFIIPVVYEQCEG